MHCPRCGQQQISDETKFCSRCGFQLAVVAELLTHGGFLPQLAELYRKKTIFTRKNGLVFSLFWFIFFVMILTSFWAIVDVEEMAAVSAVIGIFGGLMLLISSLVFLKKAPKAFDENAGGISGMDVNTLYAPANRGALPPPQSQPVSSYSPPEGSWKGPDTGEFAPPGSVTERTTRLLKKDEQ